MANDVSKLAPFTGYYSMNVASGAFLSIDTTEVHAPGASNTTTIDINVSMDGKHVETYSFKPLIDGATFDGRTLHIPGQPGQKHIHLDFTREYDDGYLVAFSGTIGSVAVKGESYFNPVPLSAFVGDYYYVDPKTGASTKVVSLTSATEILFDFSALSKPSGKLQPVDAYSYVPAMFVVTFKGTGSGPGSFMLMMGTASNYGLACSIQDNDKPQKYPPVLAISAPPSAKV